MKKKIIGAIIALLVAIALTVVFLQGDKNNTNSQKPSKGAVDNSQGVKIKFNGLATIVNSEDKNCNSDNDCVLFSSDCGDCEFDVINKNALLKYNEAKTEYCSTNKPEVMCDIIFTGKLKCVNNKCAIN